MKYLFCLSIFAVSFNLFAADAPYSPHIPYIIPKLPHKYDSRTIRVGVLDSGFDFYSKWSSPQITVPKMCNFGHKDFTGNGLRDIHGHGTHVIGLIAKYAGNANYCIVVVKYCNTGPDSIKSFKAGLKYLHNIKVDMLNISAGGAKYDSEEDSIIKSMLSNDLVIVAAAGNNGKNLDVLSGKYYPAVLDSRIVVVGNLSTDMTPHWTSNYGTTVDFWEVGTEVSSTLPNNRVGTMTGTSQATAIRSGKILKKWHQK